MIRSLRETTCPGCGLEMPARPDTVYEGYYHSSPECWQVFTEVLGAEFGNAGIFAAVHQLTVDAYAVQHAGGGHPDKSVDVHLAGLHLALEHGTPSPRIPPLLQRLVAATDTWPHFAPPPVAWNLTAADVALAGSAREHVALVRRWAGEVWGAWSAVHDDVRLWVARHL